jgi:hypothetical protein
MLNINSIQRSMLDDNDDLNYYDLLKQHIFLEKRNDYLKYMTIG